MICGDVVLTSKSIANKYQPKKHKNPRKEKHLACESCGKLFASRLGYNKHLVKAHGRDIEKVHIQCDICPKRFVSELGFQYHRDVYHSDDRRLVKCELCAKTFKTENGLEYHKRNAHSTWRKRFKCDSCEKTFLTNGGLTHHWYIKHGGKALKALKGSDQLNTKKGTGATRLDKITFNDDDRNNNHDENDDIDDDEEEIHNGSHQSTRRRHKRKCTLDNHGNINNNNDNNDEDDNDNDADDDDDDYDDSSNVNNKDNDTNDSNYDDGDEEEIHNRSHQNTERKTKQNANSKRKEWSTSKCDSCEKTFFTNEGLSYHWKLEHGGKGSNRLNTKKGTGATRLGKSTFNDDDHNNNDDEDDDIDDDEEEIRNGSHRNTRRRHERKCTLVDVASKNQGEKTRLSRPAPNSFGISNKNFDRGTEDGTDNDSIVEMAIGKLLVRVAESHLNGLSKTHPVSPSEANDFDDFDHAVDSSPTTATNPRRSDGILGDFDRALTRMIESKKDGEIARSEFEKIDRVFGQRFDDNADSKGERVRDERPHDHRRMENTRTRSTTTGTTATTESSSASLSFPWKRSWMPSFTPSSASDAPSTAILAFQPIISKSFSLSSPLDTSAMTSFPDAQHTYVIPGHPPTEVTGLAVESVSVQSDHAANGQRAPFSTAASLRKVPSAEAALSQTAASLRDTTDDNDPARGAPIPQRSSSSTSTASSRVSYHDCCVCLLPFRRDNDQLRLHILEHLKVLDWEQTACPLCSLDCHSREMMAEHFLVTHGGVEILLCSFEDCQRTCWTKRQLKSHIRNHAAMNP